MRAVYLFLLLCVCMVTAKHIPVENDSIKGSLENHSDTNESSKDSHSFDDDSDSNSNEDEDELKKVIKEQEKRNKEIEKQKQKEEKRRIKEDEKHDHDERKKHKNQNKKENKIDLDDVFKQSIYQKYGLPVSSTKLEKQAAIDRYFVENFGLPSFSTESQKRDAIIQLASSGDRSAFDEIKNIIYSSVDNVEIQQAREKLEREIQELNIRKSILSHTPSPWAQFAIDKITKKQAFLQSIMQLTEPQQVISTGNTGSLSNQNTLSEDGQENSRILGGYNGNENAELAGTNAAVNENNNIDSQANDVKLYGIFKTLGTKNPVTSSNKGMANNEQNLNNGGVLNQLPQENNGLSKTLHDTEFQNQLPAVEVSENTELTRTKAVVNANNENEQSTSLNKSDVLTQSPQENIALSKTLVKIGTETQDNLSVVGFEEKPALNTVLIGNKNPINNNGEAPFENIVLNSEVIDRNQEIGSTVDQATSIKQQTINNGNILKELSQNNNVLPKTISEAGTIDLNRLPAVGVEKNPLLEPVLANSNIAEPTIKYPVSNIAIGTEKQSIDMIQSDATKINNIINENGSVSKYELTTDVYITTETTGTENTIGAESTTTADGTEIIDPVITEPTLIILPQDSLNNGQLTTDEDELPVGVTDATLIETQTDVFDLTTQQTDTTFAATDVYDPTTESLSKLPEEYTTLNYLNDLAANILDIQVQQ